MKGFRPRKADTEGQSIEELTRAAAAGKLSRRKFITALTAMGASATAVATFVAVSRQMGHTTAPTTAAPKTTQEQQNIQLHNQHISQRQTAPQTPTPAPATRPGATVDPRVEGYVAALLADYHPDAVVEDTLVGAPAIGHAAIADRKRQEALGMRGLAIEVVSRFANGDQVIAEWVATGVHTGTFMGYPASNRPFNIRGMTVVTRRDGLIVKESLFYDLAEVKRQLAF